MLHFGFLVSGSGRWMLGASLALAVVLSGCEGAPQAAKVNPDAARTALTAALDAWKSGQAPKALKSHSPAITAQDMDWESGEKLLSYEVLGTGEDDDANLRVPVELTLQGPGGRETRRKVTYVVGTSPAITVFRELF